MALKHLFEIINICLYAMDIPALQVAELYKNRWQVELFFKWLKQHLKIKKFWGTTENAVRIQIYAAICAYCLV
ncbi:IS4 transposase, partial [Dysgonomonas sp. PH5-45]|nr:IS4 transposase [Dysgonomonas sp. PH5-45]MDH6389025.1 IS4 transposase [Dysgonomonas sp. PH5-37]